MKSAKELIQAGQRTRKEEDSTPNFSAEQKQTWAKVWAMLEASRLVTEPVTSSTSLYWMSQVIHNAPQKLLRAAVELTKRHKGYLTLGHLHEAVREQKDYGAYKEFKALERKSLPKEEIRERIAKMREELDI